MCMRMRYIPTTRLWRIGNVLTNTHYLISETKKIEEWNEFFGLNQPAIIQNNLNAIKYLLLFHNRLGSSFFHKQQELPIGHSLPVTGIKPVLLVDSQFVSQRWLPLVLLVMIPKHLLLLPHQNGFVEIYFLQLLFQIVFRLDSFRFIFL